MEVRSSLIEKEPIFSFVVLSFNRDDIIERNIRNLIDVTNQLNVRCEVLVIDNNSSDGTHEILTGTDWPENLTVVVNSTNLGVAAGRNTGMKIAQGRWIVVLDDDAIISIDTMLEVMNAIEASQLGIIALNVKSMNDGSLLSSSIKNTDKLSNFHGAGHVFSKELIDCIGFLDEKCTFGGEELDYSIRCIKAGFTISFIGSAVVEHYCKTRHGSEGMDRRTKWLFNYIRIIFKHFPFRYAVVYSLRYVTSSLYSAYQSYGVKVLLALLWSALQGAVSGRNEFNTEGDFLGFCNLYLDKDMRPEYGNVPLVNKVNGRL